MNKKSKIYLIVLIWASVLLQLAINNSIDREKQMVEQVMSQGVENLVEGSTRAYAYYGDQELSDEVKEEMVKSLAKKLGVTTGYEVTHLDIQAGRTTTLAKLGQNGDTTIKVMSIIGEDEYQQTTIENYVMVELKLKGAAAKHAGDYCDRLREIYKDLGMNPTTNIYLCSQLKGELVSSQKDEKVAEFLESTNAKTVEAVEFDNNYLVYGYSKNIDEYVLQDDEKVNVNIAFQYDPAEDVTYIHMGVPFVDRSF
ncbi:MAG: YwmB family TATA-box binding protein [Lachnospiraceae bacterium]|nr:YwmB family TATA-box binding protein [Lachnospiraceae bacterium]